MAERTNEAGLLPIEDRVLVRLIDTEEKTAGGIVLARETQEKESMADIHGYFVDAGEEGRARLAEYDIKVGDLIVFAKYSGLVYIGKNGLRYRIMNAADVVAKSEGVYDKTFRGRMPLGVPSATPSA